MLFTELVIHAVEATLKYRPNAFNTIGMSISVLFFPVNSVNLTGRIGAGLDCMRLLQFTNYFWMLNNWKLLADD